MIGIVPMQKGEPMGDFEKSINASDLIEWIMCTFPDWCEGSVREIVDHVNEMPSAQPEIIRCKDCEFWTHIKRTKRHWCKTDDGLYGLNTFADDFCSRARRRTDD